LHIYVEWIQYNITYSHMTNLITFPTWENSAQKDIDFWAMLWVRDATSEEIEKIVTQSANANNVFSIDYIPTVILEIEDIIWIFSIENIKRSLNNQPKVRKALQEQGRLLQEILNIEVHRSQPINWNLIFSELQKLDNQKKEATL
jgi:hypothetical protein